MRILHWYQNFLGGGGVANAVLGLANAQSRLGHTVLLATMETQQRPLYEPLSPHLECEILTWRPRVHHRLGNLEIVLPERSLIARLNDWRPDIVHLHGEFLLSNIWASRTLRCPAVLTSHGTFHPGLLKSGSGKQRLFRLLYLHFAKAVSYRRLLAFHVLSTMEEYQVRKMAPGVNVYRLPQGPPIHVQRLLKLNGDSHNHSDSGSCRLIYVGRLDVHIKGLDILLRAFAQAIGSLPFDGVSLTLVGPDWRGGLEELRRLAGQLGIEKRVNFTGAKRPEEAMQLLHEADLFLLLSRNEGFGISLAEALLVGRPALVSTAVGCVTFSEIASLPHVISVKPETEAVREAIIHCLKYVRELKLSAEMHVHQVTNFFDWSRIAALHIQKYRDFLQSRLVRRRSYTLKPAIAHKPNRLRAEVLETNQKIVP